jgi:hypothetical protein
MLVVVAALVDSCGGQYSVSIHLLLGQCVEVDLMQGGLAAAHDNGVAGVRAFDFRGRVRTCRLGVY